MTFTDLRTGAGVEKFLLNLIRHSPKDGIDIKVVQTDYLTSQRVSDEYINETLQGFRTLRMKVYETKFDFMWNNRILGAFSTMIFRPILMTYLNIKYNRDIIDEVSKADVIYLFKNEYSRYFKKTSGIIVGSNHCDYHNDKKPETILTKKGLEKLVYKGISTYHLFPGKSNFTQFFGDGRTFILPPGVDTKMYYPSSAQKNKLKILFVGRLEKSKGILEFLKVYDLLKEERKFEFHVVGSGSLTHEVRSKSGADFIYHGAVDEEELSRIYRSCDVFLFPTHLDSFPVVILEALASGLYVITTEEMRGTFDEFEQSNYITYVDPEPLKLRELLLEIIRNDVIDSLNKDALFEKVQNNYEWSNISTKFFELLVNLNKTDLK